MAKKNDKATRLIIKCVGIEGFFKDTCPTDCALGYTDKKGTRCCILGEEKNSIPKNPTTIKISYKN